MQCFEWMRLTLTGSFDSSFSWFSVILIKLHEKVIMTSVVCYVNIRVRRGKFQVFRDWWIDCQYGPWKVKRVLCAHHPCSRAVLTKSIARQCFFRTAREHGPCSQAPVHTTREHGPCARPVFMGDKNTDVFTGRVHGPWTRPVNTGSVYRTEIMHALYIHLYSPHSGSSKQT